MFTVIRRLSPNSGKWFILLILILIHFPDFFGTSVFMLGLCGSRGNGDKKED
jgi:hypothetical protein